MEKGPESKQRSSQAYQSIPFLFSSRSVEVRMECGHATLLSYAPHILLLSLPLRSSPFLSVSFAFPVCSFKRRESRDGEENTKTGLAQTQSCLDTQKCSRVARERGEDYISPLKTGGVRDHRLSVVPTEGPVVDWWGGGLAACVLQPALSY
ncbi:hypothetical protein H6P81_018938 [Aristolochia fimbriata]|uniref:Uncharacterized protein n=1 Tax=Aristolochia fimbriata TaxID=158543 RepID=A0AAV7E3K9_ARIFI|nr:hypothetical protein H6P81_018938 [Aristolochia fimbriata]